MKLKNRSLNAERASRCRYRNIFSDLCGCYEPEKTVNLSSIFFSVFFFIFFFFFFFFFCFFARSYVRLVTSLDSCVQFSKKTRKSKKEIVMIKTKQRMIMMMMMMMMMVMTKTPWLLLSPFPNQAQKRFLQLWIPTGRLALRDYQMNCNSDCRVMALALMIWCWLEHKIATIWLNVNVMTNVLPEMMRKLPPIQFMANHSSSFNHLIRILAFNFYCFFLFS